MEHISLEKILSYTGKRLDDREAREVEGHLATCERCHEVFMGLNSAGIAVGRAFDPEPATSLCPEDWEMAALVRKELPSQTAEKIKTHLKDCGFCVDRAAGYYKALHFERPPFITPEQWKHKAVQGMENRHAVMEEAKVSLMQRILSSFSQMTSPLPAVAGLAIALLAIAVITWIILPGKGTLQALASNETLLMRDSEIPSSLGFSGTDDIREVSKMDISLNGKEIIFMWKPIEGAVEYNFTLMEGKHPVYDVKTGNGALVALSNELIETHTTYNWLITGRTADNRYFEYKGNVVLVK
ncbi:MAG: zf-HC2 domain-containing protein [Nitrospiraceae bacterium]|nr:MAG: zf-HC2 domain-containing protein [Nitrospiraceae bacterium]